MSYASATRLQIAGLQLPTHNVAASKREFGSRTNVCSSRVAVPGSDTAITGMHSRAERALRTTLPAAELALEKMKTGGCKEADPNPADSRRRSWISETLDTHGWPSSGPHGEGQQNPAWASSHPELIPRRTSLRNAHPLLPVSEVA